MADAKRVTAASALFGAATVWPNALCLLSELTASPLERAVRASWCGVAHLATPAHCPVCWLGAGFLAMLAALIAVGEPKASRAR